MRWIDGSDIDIKEYSGEDLCEKLGSEMYKTKQEDWFACEEFIQNALLIIDFDTVINMEGFPTPHYGYFTTEYYNRIVAAFRAIGDANDADVLAEAGKLDLYYETLLNAAKGTEKWNVIYDEFSNKLDKLEEELYLNTEFDIWTMLYEYLDRQKNSY